MTALNITLLLLTALAVIALIASGKIKGIRKWSLEGKIYELDQELDDIGLSLYRMDEDFNPDDCGPEWHAEHARMLERRAWCNAEIKRLKSRHAKLDS